jgi:hypothetical protein
MLLNLFRRWSLAIAPRSLIESYIIAQGPQSITDVERLTREYHYRTTKGIV